MIYFIRNSRTGHVKIGLSDDPKRRIVALQIANSDPLEFLGCLPGGVGVERELHRQFAPFHVRGEWFHGDPPLVDFVESALACQSTTPASGGFSPHSFRGVFEPGLCYLASVAVGFPVSIYWMGLSGPHGEDTEYQVMRWDESPGPGKEFWDWYLRERPQFHPTPLGAVIAFVYEYREWVQAS